MLIPQHLYCLFFFNDTATTEIYTLSLHDALPICAPGLMDYVSLPGRRAPLDLRVEALSAAAGLRVRCRSGLVARGRRVRPAPGEALVVNLAWGQEAPGVVGTWGWHPLRPATYQTGGPSGLLAAVDGREWLGPRSNPPGLQPLPAPGPAGT